MARIIRWWQQPADAVFLLTLAFVSVACLSATALGFGLSSSYTELQQTAADRDEWKAASNRNYESVSQWKEHADGYAKQLTTLQAEHQALTELHAALRDKHIDLLNRWADLNWQQGLSAAFLRWADAGVSACESTDNPKAVNGRQVGLLQIDIPSHEARIARHGYTPADMLRPIPNLIVAEDIWREQGAAPWPTCGKRSQR